jgi:L-ascorbate metabolism protein UlaG (beta-lactamase superfamily)
VIEPALSDDAFLADLEAVRLRAGTVDLWWLGQSGFLMYHRGRWALVDPYLSDSLTAKYAKTDKPHVRMAGRVISPAKLARGIGQSITITSSHAHTDHLDPDTLRPLVESGVVDKIIAPQAAFALAIERSSAANTHRPPSFEGADEGSGHQIGAGIKVKAIAAAHETIERDEAGHCKFLGYVFEFSPFAPDARGEVWMFEKELTIYHSGDTIVYDGMVERLRQFKIDVAILPINGKVGNMNGAMAARLAKEIGASLVIPCHYDMFEFNTADPADEFIPECERIGQAYRVLRLGERFSSSEIPR